MKIVNTMGNKMLMSKMIGHFKIELILPILHNIVHIYSLFLWNGFRGVEFFIFYLKK